MLEERDNVCESRDAETCSDDKIELVLVPSASCERGR